MGTLSSHTKTQILKMRKQENANLKREKALLQGNQNNNLEKHFTEFIPFTSSQELQFYLWVDDEYSWYLSDEYFKNSPGRLTPPKSLFGHKMKKDYYQSLIIDYMPKRGNKKLSNFFKHHFPTKVEKLSLNENCFKEMRNFSWIKNDLLRVIPSVTMFFLIENFSFKASHFQWLVNGWCSLKGLKISRCNIENKNISLNK